MALETQIAANRANAQKSTGPKTAEGKAASAQNAMKHGMTAHALLVFDEAEQDYMSFRESVRRDYEPQGAAEEEIVERIVMAAWFIRRAWRTEAATIDAAAYEEAERRARRAIGRELRPEPPVGRQEESEHYREIEARFRTLSRAEVMAYAADPTLGPRPPAFPAALVQLARYAAHHQRAQNQAIGQLLKLREARRKEEAAEAAARRARLKALERQGDGYKRHTHENPDAYPDSGDAAKRSQYFEALRRLNGGEPPPDAARGALEPL